VLFHGSSPVRFANKGKLPILNDARQQRYPLRQHFGEVHNLKGVVAKEDPSAYILVSAALKILERGFNPLVETAQSRPY
jgi:hypothetical protein